MSARQRVLPESLGGTQPKAFAIATFRGRALAVSAKKTHSKAVSKLHKSERSTASPEIKGVDRPHSPKKAFVPRRKRTRARAKDDPSELGSQAFHREIR